MSYCFFFNKKKNRDIESKYYPYVVYIVHGVEIVFDSMFLVENNNVVVLLLIIHNVVFVYHVVVFVVVKLVNHHVVLHKQTNQTNEKNIFQNKIFSVILNLPVELIYLLPSVDNKSY